MIPPSTSVGVAKVRSDDPTANWIPVNTAPSGTGAVPVRVSGPVTAAYRRPSCSQNTRPQVPLATDVIVDTCSARHVHTDSTHGESDARVSKSSPTSEY